MSDYRLWERFLTAIYSVWHILINVVSYEVSGRGGAKYWKMLDTSHSTFKILNSQLILSSSAGQFAGEYGDQPPEHDIAKDNLHRNPHRSRLGFWNNISKTEGGESNHAVIKQG